MELIRSGYVVALLPGLAMVVYIMVSVVAGFVRWLRRPPYEPPQT